MTNEAAGGELSWLIAPLQAREVRVFVAVADDAPLTPQMRAALEQLASALQESLGPGDDVQGYAACDPNFHCGPMTYCGFNSVMAIGPGSGGPAVSFGMTGSLLGGPRSGPSSPRP